MKFSRRIACLLAAMLISASLSFSQDPKPPAPPPAAPPAAKSAAPKPAALGQRRELTLRVRLQLGLTLGNMLDAARELREESEVDEHTDRSVTSALILDRLAAKNPEAFAAADIDKDKALEFIEALFRFIYEVLKGTG